MSPVLTPKEAVGKTVATSVRLSKKLLDEIRVAADASGLSRNEAIAQMLKWALEQHKQETAGKTKK